MGLQDSDALPTPGLAGLLLFFRNWKISVTSGIYPGYLREVPKIWL